MNLPVTGIAPPGWGGPPWAFKSASHAPGPAGRSPKGYALPDFDQEDRTCDRQDSG